jgi:hypothetical protein
MAAREEKFKMLQEEGTGVPGFSGGHRSIRFSPRFMMREVEQET